MYGKVTNPRVAMIKRILSIITILAVTVLATSFNFSNNSASATVPGINTLTSVNDSGNGQGGDQSSGLSNFNNSSSQIVSNGRFIAFNSNATNLVANDTNNTTDVFVRDTKMNTTIRVNTSTLGVQANGISHLADISSNGRYILYISQATNLIDGATRPIGQLYIYDQKTATTDIAIRHSLTGAYVSHANAFDGYSVSDDGRFVLFKSVSRAGGDAAPSGQWHLYAFDRDTNIWTPIDVPIDGIYYDVGAAYAQMSCDGAFAVFVSSASNLVAGDTNAQKDVFLVDMRRGVKIKNITQAANGNSNHPKISCNGEHIAFNSQSTNIVSGVPGSPNTLTHVYSYNRLDDTFALVDRNNSGAIASSSVGNGGDFDIDNAGNAIFISNASNMPAPWVAQLYLRNNEASTTEMLSIKSDGTPSGSGIFYKPTLSADGKFIAYCANDGSGLIAGDANGAIDIMLSKTGM